MKARNFKRENFYFLSIRCFHSMEYYYINDHLFTPQKMIDVNGNVVWQADWDSFGEVNLTVNTIENNLRFPGQYYDSETGFYYNFHRYYSPEIGRYLREDPAGGSGNYFYVNSNPVSFVDYLGLWVRPGYASECTIEVKCRPLNVFGGDFFATIEPLLRHCYMLVEDTSNNPVIIEAHKDDVSGIDEPEWRYGRDEGGILVKKIKDCGCKIATCLINGVKEFKNRRYAYNFLSKNCNFFVLWDWCKCKREFLGNLFGFTTAFRYGFFGGCSDILSSK